MEIEPPTGLKPEAGPRVTPTRCPFCRTAVALEAEAWVACETCLARHHVTCWREHGSCSSCAGRRSLLPRRRTRRALAPLVLAASVALAGAALDTARRTHEAQTLAAHALEERDATLARRLEERAAAADQLERRVADLERRLEAVADDARADRRTFRSGPRSLELAARNLEPPRDPPPAPGERDRTRIAAEALCRGVSERLHDINRPRVPVSSAETRRRYATEGPDLVPKLLEASRLSESMGDRVRAQQIQKVAEALSRASEPVEVERDLTETLRHWARSTGPG